MDVKNKETKKAQRAPRSANWSAEETLRFVSALIDIGRNGILNQTTNGCTPERRAHEYERIALSLNADLASTGIVRNPLHLQNRFKQIKQYLQAYTTWQRQVSMGTGGGLGKPMPVSVTIPLTGAMLELLAILRDRFTGLQSELDSDMALNEKNENIDLNQTLQDAQTLSNTEPPADTQTSLVIENLDEGVTICSGTREKIDIVDITGLPLQVISSSSCNTSNPLVNNAVSTLQKETPSPRQYFATATQQRKRKSRSPIENETEMRKQLIQLELTQSRELHAINLSNARELHSANMEEIMLRKTLQIEMSTYLANREREAQERHERYLRITLPRNMPTTDLFVQEELKTASILDEFPRMDGIILPPKKNHEHSE